MLPGNIIKRGPIYYKFVSSERAEETDGITQQKGKLLKLSPDNKPQANTYKFYIED